MGDLLRFAWPSIASFVCNSAYRVNDQFWVGGLGASAQAALAACTFVMILNFGVYFLVVAGTLPQIARATGAGDIEGRHSIAAAATSLQVSIGLVQGALGWFAAPWIAQVLGLEGAVAAQATEYLQTGFLFCVPMGLAALVDNLFFGIGDTRTPLLLQMLAICINFVVNPIFVYGTNPIEGFGLLRSGTGEPWLGISGAAMATGLSRATAASLGLFLLYRVHGLRWWPRHRPRVQRLLRILALGWPSALSVGIYAGVYFAMLRIVFEPLPSTVMAGFGLGFNAFEGIAFPFYLGLSVAGASLVGRCLGADDLEATRTAVRNVRIAGLTLGVLFACVFYFLGPVLVPLFTTDAEVVAAATLYVTVLGASQIFVALESVSEKILLGSGLTRPIFWISVPGNLARLPAAWFLALHLGWGALGIWWAINITTAAKALAFHLLVRTEPWTKDGA